MATASPTTTQLKSKSDRIASLDSTILSALGSLKLTVALFACSLVIVLVGTLAQDEMNMFDVKQRYFTSVIAWLHFDDLFPQAFFPHSTPIRGVIPVPGGALIGLMLMVNLVAAKATRFRVQASSGQLATGIGFLIAGVVVGALLVASGHNSEGLQGNPPEWLGYAGLWRGVQIALGLGCVSAVVGISQSKHRVAKILFAVLAVATGGYLLFTVVNDYRIGEPGLRIVWQLTKGLGAGLILMVGCLLVFGKQGGNMLLHLGVGLLMVGQLAFGDRQLEQRLSLVEGQSSNALVNLDKVELSFIQSDSEEDAVIGVPGSRLLAAKKAEETISDPTLPVDIKVLEFYENSRLGDTTKSNLATTGHGQDAQAEPKRKSGGTDSEVNIASAYVELLDKDSGDSLGTHLVSQMLSDREMLLPGQKVEDLFDEITVGENDFKLGLRYHREVKPYWVQLEDVRRVNYSGTETPRDYSSFIRIVDTETGVDRRDRVWMNNPLRYRGETFFQSNYTALPSGKEVTGLQVVRNSGWLIPYIACSITALGMLVHFLSTLSRFLNRREREIKRELDASPSQSSKRTALVWSAVAVYAVMILGSLQPWTAFSYGQVDAETASAAKGDDETFDFATAGAIPIQFGGRVMPLDAYARQTLKAMSNKESLPMDDIPVGIKKRVGENAKKLSAMQWLFEIAIDEPKIRFVPMFRIDSEEVRAEVDVDRRKSKLYSLDEIGTNWNRVHKLIQAASKKDTADQSFKEKKLRELDLRTRNYTLAAACFQLPIPEDIPARFFPPGTSEERMQLFAVQELEQKLNALENMRAPNMIPPTPEVAADAVNDPKWTSFGQAFFQDAKARISEEGDARAGVDSFADMIQAYAKDDKAAFNEAVTNHLASVQSYPIPGYQPSQVSLERWMQAKWPTGIAMIMYTSLLVLSLACLLINLPSLRSAVWGMLIVTFLIHTLAIVCRVVITNRAPVINIYSSAVFIGWAGAGFGLIIEALFRRGTGNMLAATAGMMTLLVAYGLNTGDTMPVLQAVLDTQFWLTTHVISVSLGYVATMVAGCFGIGYLIANWCGASKKMQQELYRCCYGTACFGILFSFVGTLLGGLWADDSWGRFWGWDPKENGALLIVIWNALMLHARWDGMVKARGFSILAIGGNIITAWSWFGTNELGIGLHSYGFTSGVLMWLSIFVASQLAFIFLGMLFHRKPPEEPTF